MILLEGAGPGIVLDTNSLWARQHLYSRAAAFINKMHAMATAKACNEVSGDEICMLGVCNDNRRRDDQGNCV